jgi:hypothetical protein
MSSSQPPRVARWLLEGWARSPNRESLVGDLFEQYHGGRSASWFWRQTARVLVIGVATELWQHKLLTAFVTLLSAYLGDIYTFSRVWVWVWRVHQLWYPHVINSRLSWMVVNPWAYRLRPYDWTSEIAWCAILAAMSVILTRWHPRQRGLVVIFLFLPQVGIRLPYLLSMDPRSPIGLFAVLWFSSFTLIAIPFSILLGALWGSDDHSIGLAARV